MHWKIRSLNPDQIYFGFFFYKPGVIHKSDTEAVSQRSLLWALRDDDRGGKAAGARLARRFDLIGQPVTERDIQQTQNAQWTKMIFFSRWGREQNSATVFKGFCLISSLWTQNAFTFPPLWAWARSGTTARRPRLWWTHSFCRTTAGAGFEQELQIPVNKEANQNKVS